MRINLASGQRPFKNWTNIDIRKQKDGDGNYYQCEIEADVKKLPLKDNSADIMVAHHVVEHFRLNEISEVVREWQRVLKPGGKLAVFVPDMRPIANRWLRGDIDNFTFLVNCYGAYQGHDTDIHKWGYDDIELRDRMSGWDGRKKHILWSEIKKLTREECNNNPLYEGSDIAWDWWILAMEFTK